MHLMIPGARRARSTPAQHTRRLLATRLPTMVLVAVFQPLSKDKVWFTLVSKFKERILDFGAAMRQVTILKLTKM